MNRTRIWVLVGVLLALAIIFLVMWLNSPEPAIMAPGPPGGSTALPLAQGTHP